LDGMEWIDAEEEERGGISDGAGDAATCLPWFVLSRVPFPGWEWLRPRLVPISRVTYKSPDL
jgi:hypothetical protein